MASNYVAKIVEILASDVFVDYSEDLPFTDSDQFEIRAYFKEHPEEDPEQIYEYFVEVQKILKEFDEFDEFDPDLSNEEDDEPEDPEDRLMDRFQTMKQELQDSRLIKWCKDKYQRY